MSVISPNVDPDSLAAVLRTVFAAREYHWVGTSTSTAWVWLLEHVQRLLEWLEHLRLAFPVHYYILVGAMILLLTVMLAHLTWVVWLALRPPAGVGTPAIMTGPVRDAAWHLAEALRLGAAGRFAEALAHRFLAAVLDLDGQHVLQFHPSKTPAEYAREARLDDVGRSELADLVASLYRHVFGGAPCDAAEWQRFDARAVEIGLHAATR